MSTSTPAWTDRFATLLAGEHAASGDPVDAGAQLVVTDPDGTEVFRQGLARHHRADDEDDHLIWVRPLVGGSEAPDLGWVFNLNVARRRALRWRNASVTDSGDVVLELASGQIARIQPAEDDQLATVQRWDSFTDRLTRDEEAALDRLDADSWHGQFS
ncbi:hypothetical protein ACWEQL_20275 [Kitasatospora sp. NPDC004240]